VPAPQARRDVQSFLFLARFCQFKDLLAVLLFHIRNQLRDRRVAPVASNLVVDGGFPLSDSGSDALAIVRIELQLSNRAIERPHGTFGILEFSL
jgi:hypothetical protein